MPSLLYTGIFHDWFAAHALSFADRRSSQGEIITCYKRIGEGIAKELLHLCSKQYCFLLNGS